MAKARGWWLGGVVWVALFGRLVAGGRWLPGQLAVGGFVLDRLLPRFDECARFVSQGPAQVAFFGDWQGGEEHLFADDVDDSSSVQRFVHIVLHPSQSQVDAAIGEFSA